MSAPESKRMYCRSNKAQINYLCQYMANHPNFAAGEFRSPQGARVMAEEWLSLKAALDELGPHRTVEQWKICWRDQKLKARKDGASHARAVNTTGNSVNIPEISDNSALILNAIGPEMASGMGPDEAPIGFDPVMIDEEQDRDLLPLRLPTRSTQQRQQRQRKRRSLPSEKFLQAQLELNGLMKDLITEVRRSNELREQLLNSNKCSSTNGNSS